eukprot:TRINITY_DN2045_c9_g1_i2.p1 TRINITY_DN2045_c9_g1~~TRINITY_DN2045_c9_g1_i2.p1  ORF type:complete len:207 (+),score=46.20 TRINITY_DN2045_c9_g1_i2:459-1079(+)
MGGMGMESAEENKGDQGDLKSPEDTSSSTKKKGMKVLVALDHSDGSLYAFKWAVENLFPTSSSSSSSAVHPQTQVVHEEGGGAEHGSLILLHVQEVSQPYIVPAGPAIYSATEVVESVRKAQEQNSAALLAHAREICKGRAIKVDTMILNGDPKDMICQAVEQIQSDLLLVGSRGLGMIKRAFLGSVSDYCAHHAKCPVLIVKPPK